MCGPRLPLFVAVLCSGVSASAIADPVRGVSCRRAATPVEHVLCSDGDPALPWLDRTLAALFAARLAAPGADRPALLASERAWLAIRDRTCRGDADVIADCLLPLYWRRVRLLDSAVDPMHLAGTYAAPSIHGTLRAVALPRGAVALDIESNVGPPSFDNCALTATLSPRPDGALVDDAGAAVPGCRFTITHAAGHFVVRSTSCPGYCGMDATLDGDYAATP